MGNAVQNKSVVVEYNSAVVRCGSVAVISHTGPTVVSFILPTATSTSLHARILPNARQVHMYMRCQLLQLAQLAMPIYLWSLFDPGTGSITLQRSHQLKTRNNQKHVNVNSVKGFRTGISTVISVPSSSSTLHSRCPFFPTTAESTWSVPDRRIPRPVRRRLRNRISLDIVNSSSSRDDLC